MILNKNLRKHIFYKSVFDLLKNKRLDMTTSVILCLISKLFLGLDKLCAKGPGKNLNFCPPLNHGTTFCPPHKFLKYQNNLLSTKHCTNSKFVKHLKHCFVLFYLVLSYIVMSSTYILQIKWTLSVT
jgi:hypothetical protein